MFWLFILLDRENKIFYITKKPRSYLEANTRRAASTKTKLFSHSFPHIFYQKDLSLSLFFLSNAAEASSYTGFSSIEPLCATWSRPCWSSSSYEEAEEESS